jgi:SPP1 family predicted phage head-tail adaptor
MRAGKLRHRLTIQEYSKADDSFGEPIKTWANISSVPTVWGSIEPISGNEFFTARQIASETTHRITIRYKEGLDNKMRFKFGSRYFYILSVLDKDEKGVEMEIMCREDT